MAFTEYGGSCLIWLKGTPPTYGSSPNLVKRVEILLIGKCGLALVGGLIDWCIAYCTALHCTVLHCIAHLHIDAMVLSGPVIIYD